MEKLYLLVTLLNTLFNVTDSSRRTDEIKSCDPTLGTFHASLCSGLEKLRDECLSHDYYYEIDVFNIDITSMAILNSPPSRRSNYSAQNSPRSQTPV